MPTCPAEGGGKQEKDKPRMKTENRESESWTRIMQDPRLREGVGEYGMEACLSKLRLKEDTGTKLILEYPEDLPIMWVELNYMDYIISAASGVLQGARTLEFVPATSSVSAKAEPEQAATPEAELPLIYGDAHTEQAEKPVKRTPTPRKSRSSRAVASFNSGLNGDYTFDNFIVGDNNRFAYSAAQALVDKPGESYNPLFIHGDSGLGKTHLLQAIGNALRAKDEELRVLYVTSETFANGYIEALMNKCSGLSNFRKKYRRADVLLIDDIQFLAKKDKTQEEFFHTFNSLFESGKQIVLCADCAAKDVVGLDARLSSRFEQGLSVELQAPAYETRIAILRAKRARWKDALVSDEVLEYLAKNITRSVRRLEGALTRLAAFSSISNRPPTLTDARVQIKDFLGEENNAILSIKDIQKCVADEFNLRVADLNGRRRTANIAHPRQIAMFLARHHTANSLQDIGAAFGGRDHGTVIHATRTIEQKMEADTELRSTINRMLASLGA